MCQKIFSNKVPGCGTDVFGEFCEINTFPTEHLCEHLIERLDFNLLFKTCSLFLCREGEKSRYFPSIKIPKHISNNTSEHGQQTNETN